MLKVPEDEGKEKEKKIFSPMGGSLQVEVIPSKRKNEEMMKADGNMNKRGGQKNHDKNQSMKLLQSRIATPDPKNENQEDNV